LRNSWLLFGFLTLWSLSAERRWYTGGGAHLVLPYSWHTDSVYTYDTTVDWYRSVRYDFGAGFAPSLQVGFEESLSENFHLGVEAGYLYAPAVSRSIQTNQQVGATRIDITETATLTHHAPRLSLRLVRHLHSQWNIIYRVGIENHIVTRGIDPAPQNLPSGVNLTPTNYPARRDTYAVFTADIAAGIEYVAAGRHGIGFMLSINPPIVYPETLRNHIVMPYFATASLHYRYLW
jgi:hypothetical protein